MDRKGSSKWRPEETQVSEEETMKMRMEQERWGRHDGMSDKCCLLERLWIPEEGFILIQLLITWYSDRCSFTKWIIYRNRASGRAWTALQTRSQSASCGGFFIMSADIDTFCWNDACKKYIICTRCSFHPSTGSTWSCSPGCRYTALSYGSVCACVAFTTAAAACSLQRTIKWKQVVLEVVCFQSSDAARLRECPLTV